MLELLERIGYWPCYCVWELTLACNLKCLHCGSYAGAKRESELTLEEAYRVADALAELRCERVTLSGGEPTLRPDWHLIGRRLTDRGVGVNIISNGYHWDDEQFARAHHAGLTNLGISLDGLEPAHDRVRREGAFARTTSTIDRAVAEGWRVAVVSHINTLNMHSLPEFAQLLRDRGVVHWQLQLGLPSGHLTANRELVIDPEELLWIVPLIAELQEQGGAELEVVGSHNIGYYGKWERALRQADDTPIDVWIGCRAGIHVIGIESNGNVKGCLSLPSAMHGEDRFVEGNARERPLQEIWRDPETFGRNRSFDAGLLASFCGVCRYRDICRGGCSWAAYSYATDRYDNPYCFYRQAVRLGRLDLLDDEELSADELEVARRIER
ncbi:MAG: radical SAM protein [Deltaproteobacteria bacterium]|nr:radical SAM protein [Deltaproteobacteria bacterium]